jgi:spore maturation protein CgeB
MPGKWLIAVPPEGAARTVGLEVASAFSAAVSGDNCKIFDSKTYFLAYGSMLKSPDETMVVDLLNQTLVVQCLEFHATNVLVLALSPITLFTLNLLKSNHIQTIHWFYEDFRRASYWKDVIAGYCRFYAIQKGPIADECSRLGVQFTFLPTAASQAYGADFLKNGLAEKDVAFIGLPSSYRVRILEHLDSKGISLSIAGQGWDRYRGSLSPYIVRNSWTDARESAAILGNARIGLNLSLHDPQKDRPNTHISPRVFDVMRMGRILVTENVPLVREVLSDCAYYCFSDEFEAERIIKEILFYPEKELENIEKNRKAVEAGHLYEHRVKKILEIMEK